MTGESKGGGRRERRAAATRNSILEAAHRLFVERGYAATSIGEIADEADVAVQTIYSSVGSKRELLGALLGRLDEQAGVPDYGKKVRTERDPREVLRLGVRISRGFPEHNGDLLKALQSAAAVEPEMAEALAEGLRRHRMGSRFIVDTVRERRGLREEIGLDGGAARFATLTQFTVWFQLTDDYGWSFDEVEEWMVATLIDQLLDEGG